jgi:hypothetical protein
MRTNTILKIINRLPFYLIPVLATTLACSGCSEPHQDTYNSKEDCLKEWAEQDCTPENTGPTPVTGTSTTTHFFGPTYYPGSTTSDRHMLSSFRGTPSKTFAASSGVARGGFGSTGAGISSGG